MAWKSWRLALAASALRSATRSSALRSAVLRSTAMKAVLDVLTAEGCSRNTAPSMGCRGSDGTWDGGCAARSSPFAVGWRMATLMAAESRLVWRCQRQLRVVMEVDGG